MSWIRSSHRRGPNLPAFRVAASLNPVKESMLCNLRCFFTAGKYGGGGRLRRRGKREGRVCPFIASFWGDSFEIYPRNIMGEVDTKDNDPYCRFGYCSCVEFFYAFLFQL